MIDAIQYLYKSILPVEGFYISEYRKIDLNNKKCYVFEPIKINYNVILIVHGMTVRGIDDLRLLKQCEIFRQFGYKVYLPHYPEIQNLEIKKESIDHICKDIESIYHIENKKKIKILSISFSGTLSIISATKDLIRNSIDSLMIVGPFAHFKTILEFLLLRKDIDLYGFFIVLKNFLDIIPQYKIKGLKEAFYIAAVDNALKNSPPGLEIHFKKYPHIKKIFYKILESEQERKYILDFLINSKKIQNLCKEFDLIANIKNLNAPLLLIHGKNDKVIPPTESIWIYKECKKYHIPVKLAVTSLLDHGNVKFSAKTIVEFFNLIDVVQFFIK